MNYFRGPMLCYLGLPQFTQVRTEVNHQYFDKASTIRFMSFASATVDSDYMKLQNECLLVGSVFSSCEGSYRKISQPGRQRPTNRV